MPHPIRIPPFTIALLVVASLFPSAAFWSTSRANAHARDTAEARAVEALQASETARTQIAALQDRGRCQEGLATAVDVAVGGYLLALTSGADISAEREALREALELRAQAGRC
jgi:hypothetical protein